MAPLTLEQVSESLSHNQQGVFDMQECVTRANMTAFGTFFVGFSVGIGMQVHFSRILPRRIKSLLLISTILGLSSAVSTRQHLLQTCGEDWARSPHYNLATDSGGGVLDKVSN